MKKVLILFLVVVVLSLTACSRNVPFTSAEWKEAEWNDRQFMVKDLLNTYELVGMTREEIIDLLGHETADDPALQGYVIRNNTPSNLVYDFGAKYSDSSSNLTLIIEFDENDIVTTCELLTYSQ